jgi:methylmalonyl-CoA/ethylmalonyl-CoA epimerase
MSGWELHHVGVAVRDLRAAMPFYTGLLGYQLMSGPFDDPIQGVSVCFLCRRPSATEVSLELVAPIDDASPVAKTLNRANTAYHLCYEVADLEGSIENARAQGCVVISEPAPAVAFLGRRIAWLYAPTRNLLEVVEK